MSRRLAPAWLLLLLAATPAWAQRSFSRELIPSRTAMARIGLEPAWTGVVPLVGTERVLLVSLADTMVLAQTSESNLHAFDSESGRYLWSANLGQITTREAFPASANSTMVFATGSHNLYGLDRRTGRQVWKQGLLTESYSSSGADRTVAEVASSATAATEDRVLVGLRTGKLKVVYLKEQHATPFLWQTNGPISSRPVPTTHVDAFASEDGRVWVVRVDPPRIVYRFLTGGKIVANMATYGTRTLLVASMDHNLYAIDLFTGDKFWNFSSGAPISQEPLVGNDDVYVLNDDGELSALEIKTGTVRWTVNTGGGRLLSVGERRVYVESHDRDLFIADRQSGHLVADARSVRAKGVDVRAFDLTPTNHLNGRIYLASSSGMIVCLRDLGQIKPFLLRDPKAPPFGYLPRDDRPSAGPAAKKDQAKDADADGGEDQDKADSEGDPK